jgi:clan AA aspartic protease
VITGRIGATREAEVRLLVRGPHGDQQAIGTIVDTGFDGFLTLSPVVVAALRLAYHSPVLGTLADGTVVALRQYEAVVSWDGQNRDILVLEADGGPLIGMSLLYGSRVILDVVDGGLVTIQALP